MTDGELVRQAVQGVSGASEELARRWAARVLAFCRARVSHLHTAEDLAQEALLRGVRGLPSLAAPEKFGSWLCGIAVRVCLDWRKAKQTQQVPFSVLSHDGRDDGSTAGVAVVDDAAAGASDEAEQAEERRRLLAEIERLPELHRETLLLYYYHDVTYRDIADMLGVSTATINARLTEARALLRRRLTPVREQA
jgi:RNA polymerase sigma-70 factor (ECF subfamily)